MPCFKAPSLTSLCLRKRIVSIINVYFQPLYIRGYQNEVGGSLYTHERKTCFEYTSYIILLVL